MITDTAVRCFYCKGGEWDHDRVSGECNVYRRAEHKPLTYRVVRVNAAAVQGWRVQR